MAQESLRFGRVTEQSRGDRMIWYFIVPSMTALVALIAVAGLSISRTSGLQTQVEQLSAANKELQKSIEERDRLITASRGEDAILRSPGRGATLLTDQRPDGIASGVAFSHSEYHAVKAYLFGLTAVQPGQEYRVEVTVGKEGQRRPLSAIEPDASGSAFFLSKDVPEGVTGVGVALYPKDQTDASKAAPPLLVGKVPGVGEGGVIRQEATQTQARPPAKVKRRGR